MSRGVVDALTRGADPAEPLSPDVVVRARSRIAVARRRRASWWAGGSVALLAAAALAVGTWAAPPEAPAAAATPAPSETADPLPAVLHAEDLAATIEPRTRGVEPEDRRQAGLLCNLDDVPPESAGPGATVGTSCGAVWMGDEQMLRLEAGATTVTAYTSGDTSLVTVGWVVTNVGRTSLQLDPAGTVVSLVTDPDAVATSVTRSGLTQVARSLWESDGLRGTVLTQGAATSGSSLSDSWILGPGESASGEAIFVTAGEGPSMRVADVATRRATPTITVHVPVVPLGAPAGSLLILEAEGIHPAVVDGVSADTLAEVGVPRVVGEPPREDAQAALLCDVPESLAEGRALAIAGDFSSTYATAEASCLPLWVPGPVLTDSDDVTIVRDEGAPDDTAQMRVVWGVTNSSTATVRLQNLSLLIEALPSQARHEGSELTRLGDTIVTESSAWLPDNRRAALLSTQAFGFTMDSGTAYGAESTLFPGMLTSIDAVDADAIVDSIGGQGAATALAELPFLLTPTRVLILEVPLIPAG